MGKPDPPSGPSDETLIAITEKNIASNEKLFGEYMDWQNRATAEQNKIQEQYRELAERQFDKQSEIDQRRLELTEEAQETQDRFMDQSIRFAEKQEERADEQFDVFMEQAKGQAELSELQRNRYRELAIPEKDAYIEQLNNWDSGARRAERAGQAAADIATANESKRRQEQRRLESYGLDPSQTRSSALDQRLNTQAAVAEGRAATQARRQVEQEGLAYGGEAVNIRSGLPSSSASALGAGSSAAQGAFSASASAQAAQNQAFQTGQQGFANLDNTLASRQAAGLDSLRVAGNQMSQNFQNQIASFQTAGDFIGQSQDMNVGAFNAQVGKYQVDSQNYRTELANSPANTAAGIIGGALPLFLSEGGYVPEEASPSRGAIPDDVPARISAHEVVLPEEVVKYHGLKTLNKMTKEAKEAMGIPEEEDQNG